MINISNDNNDISENRDPRPTQNFLMKHPIIKIEEVKKYVIITLLNGEKYRVGQDGYFERCDLRIV